MDSLDTESFSGDCAVKTGLISCYFKELELLSTASSKNLPRGVLAPARIDTRPMLLSALNGHNYKVSDFQNTNSPGTNNPGSKNSRPPSSSELVFLEGEETVVTKVRLGDVKTAHFSPRAIHSKYLGPADSVALNPDSPLQEIIELRRKYAGSIVQRSPDSDTRKRFNPEGALLQFVDSGYVENSDFFDALQTHREALEAAKLQYRHESVEGQYTRYNELLRELTLTNDRSGLPLILKYCSPILPPSNTPFRILANDELVSAESFKNSSGSNLPSFKVQAGYWQCAIQWYGNSYGSEKAPDDSTEANSTSPDDRRMLYQVRIHTKTSNKLEAMVLTTVVERFADDLFAPTTNSVGAEVLYAIPGSSEHDLVPILRRIHKHGIPISFARNDKTFAFIPRKAKKIFELLSVRNQASEHAEKVLDKLLDLPTDNQPKTTDDLENFVASTIKDFGAISDRMIHAVTTILKKTAVRQGKMKTLDWETEDCREKLREQKDMTDTQALSDSRVVLGACHISSLPEVAHELTKALK